MMILYVLCGLTLAVSIANLAAVVFLSNSIFRMLVRRDILPPPARPQSGLVDLKDSPTYDPRFRS